MLPSCDQFRRNLIKINDHLPTRGSTRLCGAPNQSIFPLYYCDLVYFLYGQLCSFYMVDSSFYMVNFVLFTWSTLYFLHGQLEFLYGQFLLFYMVQLTFYMVNFLLFIWSSQLFIWSTFYMVNFLYGQLFYYLYQSG